jgi:hypothetical protein
MDWISYVYISWTTEGKAKSKMGIRREERPQEDRSEQLETKDAGEEQMERNNWANQNSQKVVELIKKKKIFPELYTIREWST